MQVQKFTIEYQTFDAARNVHTASVVLEFNDHQTSGFLCSVPSGDTLSKEALAKAMYGDALRQAMRMPENRAA